jgi:hypothetical protein
MSGRVRAKPRSQRLNRRVKLTAIKIEPIARFTTNPAGAQIVNAVGPIRQIVDPAAGVHDQRRYLTVVSVDDGKPGRPVQLQEGAIRDSGPR